VYSRAPDAQAGDGRADPPVANEFKNLFLFRDFGELVAATTAARPSDALGGHRRTVFAAGDLGTTVPMTRVNGAL
jgi:hypothetical protein